MTFLSHLFIVRRYFTLMTLLFTISIHFTFSQIPGSDSLLRQKKQDTTAPVVVLKRDYANETGKKKNAYDSSFSPRKATIRSAIFPGLGQIYNRQYWKLPIVYGTIGTTAGIFFYNLKTYKELRQSYILKVDDDTANDKLIPYKYILLSPNSLKSYRDDFRRNIDYSVLVFLLAWGLNVVDATVSAHLKQFDVNDNLSLKIKPVLTADGRFGLGLVMNLK